MAKTFDRISTFLSKPRARVKHSNDRIVELETKKELNKFLGKTQFTARVVGLPRIDEGATFTLASSANDDLNENIVYVRLEEIEDYFLPDPSTTKLDGAQQLIDLILAHPVAVVEPNVTGIKLGSLVTCEFNEGPGNLGKQRGLKVVGSLATSDQEEYADLVMKKLLAAELTPTQLAMNNGGYQQQAQVENPSTEDFAGRYGQASPTVKRFLDDLVKIIKKNNRQDLLPINVGSLFRSLGSQASIMWGNVVEGNQAAKMGWFDTTYKPNKSYASYVATATIGTNYGFYGSETKKGGYMRKYMQYEAKLVLQNGIDKKISKTDGIKKITEIYEKYYNNYQIVPSRHNLGEAIDIRTVNGSRAGIPANEYTTQQKQDLKKFAKQSQYCTFANIESLGRRGEHLHCNSKKEEGGSHGSDI
tara:strand:- start:12204 stop:13454 length:1251 start_codon:yes stop_codon:yes gene_type:complete